MALGLLGEGNICTWRRGISQFTLLNGTMVGQIHLNWMCICDKRQDRVFKILTVCPPPKVWWQIPLLLCRGQKTCSPQTPRCSYGCLRPWLCHSHQQTETHQSGWNKKKKKRKHIILSLKILELVPLCWNYKKYTLCDIPEVSDDTNRPERAGEKNDKWILRSNIKAQKDSFYLVADNKVEPAVCSHFSMLGNRWLTICLLPWRRAFG